MKHIILLLFALVLVTPCMADEEKGYLTDAYEDVYRQSQRIRERQDHYINQQREADRQREKFHDIYNNEDYYWDEDRDSDCDKNWDDYYYEDD